MNELAKIIPQAPVFRLAHATCPRCGWWGFEWPERGVLPRAFRCVLARCGHEALGLHADCTQS